MQSTELNRFLKISLAIILIICLFDMPYGYYQFVRFSAMIGFAYIAYDAHSNKNETEMFIFGALALLFQPFIKIALGRTLWNVVDVIVAIFLISTLSTKPKIK